MLTDRQHITWLIVGLGGLTRLITMWIEDGGDVPGELCEEAVRCTDLIRSTIESLGRRPVVRE